MPRILVIDDDALMRKLVEKVLTAAGHEVFQAGNGKEGLKLHRADPVDLIITDIFMPEMEGLEFIRTLRKKNPEVPVIAMSGNKHLELALELACKLGAVKALPKPFRPQELRGAVALALNSRGTPSE